MKKYLDLSSAEADKLLVMVCDSHLKLNGFSGHEHVTKLASLVKVITDECMEKCIVSSEGEPAK